MINTKLLKIVPESMKYIMLTVLFKVIQMIMNMIWVFTICDFIEALLNQTIQQSMFIQVIAVTIVAMVVRYLCMIQISNCSFNATKGVKLKLREMIYQKLLELGISYQESVPTSKVVQMAVEGVDQLETYFGSYMPQFFYSMLAPIILFIVLSRISFRAAVILLIFVPLIPMAIVAVQKFAKKLLSKYWGQYTALGDTFLENLQGLTTLKIYDADEYKNKQMNEESEKFRKITMRVLTMQLNSISVMDIVAYGGSAIGIVVALGAYRSGEIAIGGCLAIILLSSEFFIPMRQLGSYFHIAMNGIAASDNIFALLELPINSNPTESFPEDMNIQMNDVTYSYDEERNVLEHINISIEPGQRIALVGESGCGKSTLANILMTMHKGYQGSITIGGIELSDIKENEIMENITYVSHQSYLFKGSVRDNLLLGNHQATDEMLWDVLEQTRLADFLRQEDGLDTILLEKGANLSGGQRQRLALARALLHDTPIYIFDEATSNIDSASEEAIMQVIHHLPNDKTILIISHRLANIKNADHIYVLEKGHLVEEGKHDDLLKREGLYASLWYNQYNLENFMEEDEHEEIESNNM